MHIAQDKDLAVNLGQRRKRLREGFSDLLPLKSLGRNLAPVRKLAGRVAAFLVLASLMVIWISQVLKRASARNCRMCLKAFSNASWLTSSASASLRKIAKAAEYTRRSYGRTSS